VLLSHAKASKNPIYLADLDCKNAFGFGTHEILLENLKNFGIPSLLTNLIINLYENSVVSIYSQGMVSNPIAICKGVKQGCLLIPFIFNICIDPLFGFLERKKNRQYSHVTDEFPVNLVHTYADDVILIANSPEGLQKLIRGTEQFYTFSNIKFNPKKCEIFKLNSPYDLKSSLRKQECHSLWI
jgi:hypothetical protein